MVSLMILFFLGSFRSVAIVSSSIPLAILVGVAGLFITDNTLNLMTLGGLALAIGMLVDDATVAVESIHRNRMSGKRLTVAILDGAHEVATPALAATLTICIVFFPVVYRAGVIFHPRWRWCSRGFLGAEPDLVPLCRCWSRRTPTLRRRARSVGPAGATVWRPPATPGR
jgi:hypothetical protein